MSLTVSNISSTLKAMRQLSHDTLYKIFFIILSSNSLSWGVLLIEKTSSRSIIA
jgi:hypothetical protein